MNLVQRLALASLFAGSVLPPGRGWAQTAATRMAPPPVASPTANAAKAAPRAGTPVSSPEVLADSQVVFHIRAPEAKLVSVGGQWAKEKTPLQKDADGVWSATLGPVPPGVHEYNFNVDGKVLADPGNTNLKPQRWQPAVSILEVPGQPPLLTEFQDVPHGTVRVHTYRSKVLGRIRRLHVYTPPGYDKPGAGKFPTLYLLHGFGDNDATWTAHGRANYIFDNLISQGKAKPMVVVMTDGHAVAPDAVPAADLMPSNTDLYGRELQGDVLPFIEANYRVKNSADSRAIVGLSMGGQESLTVGLGHPDTFAYVAGFSAAVPSNAVLDGLLADPKALDKKLRWLWLGCGKDDSLRGRNETLDATLTAKGIRHTWFLSEGGHSWPLWRGYLAEVAPLLFAAQKK